VPEFRKLVLNAIVWTAKGEVPANGVESTPPRPEAFQTYLPVDPAWTPPPKTTYKSEPWERANDLDWVDNRFQQMDTGPTLNATADYPGPRGKVKVFKATAIKAAAGSVLFDRGQLRLAAGWTGGYLNHSIRRFGLLNTPTPAGPLAFTTSAGPGWADPDGKWDDPYPATAPLPRSWAKYRGLYLHGDRVVLSYTVGGVEVLDSPWAEAGDGGTVFARTVEVGPSDRPMKMLACDLTGDATADTADGITTVAEKSGTSRTAVALLADGPAAKLELAEKGRAVVTFPPAAGRRRVQVLIWHGVATDFPAFQRRAKAAAALPDLTAWTKPGPTRWGAPLVTRGEVAPDREPYVIDTLTVPYENPFKALMFLSGLDVMPDGSLAVCTAHGDVWLVRGVDASLRHLTWQRFATGLYQPLGLKVVDGKSHVLERGQLTRLHDLNGDGEADYYECVNNDWHTGRGEHSFDACLETDPAGNFYFFKGGDIETPTGGCLLRTSKDGSTTEIFATGFRQPVGLSVGPDGTVTGADQEGNWMPATRIDQYHKGGFYGDMRTHHRPTPPTIYDPPLCWLPRRADNSAGGQVWVPPDRFGPLGGQLLHLSYGRCRLLLVLRQQVGDVAQGGAIDLGLFFLSGVMRGRFHPGDGHLYVCGLNGWQTMAREDGCLQRVRYTGRPVTLPTGLAVEADGIRLTFPQQLDRHMAEDVANYHVERWNYRWSADYGSKHWSVAHPDREGQDPMPVTAASLSDDGRSVFLRIADLKPVMQMQLSYRLRTTAGEGFHGDLYHTIHRTAPSKTNP
jgi:hypothetical protein